MNPLTKIWFWLLILSIIGFITSFVAFETTSQSNDTPRSRPAWVWVLFIISIAFFLVSFFLYILDLSAYLYRVEVATACGEMPAPPVKMVECPKKECVKKQECVKREVCPEKRVINFNAQPVVTKQQYIVDNEIYSASGLKPLSSLAPTPIIT